MYLFTISLALIVNSQGI